VRARTVNDAHRHCAYRPMTQRPLIGPLVYILLLALCLTWAPLTPLRAAEPGAPTPVPTQTRLTPAAAAQPTAAAQLAATLPAVVTEPTHTAIALDATPTVQPTAAAPSATQPAVPADRLVDRPAAAVKAPYAAQPGTAHLAILVSECVVPVGGTASSEVFVHLEDVVPGIVRIRLVLQFDPHVVQVQDADQNAANGTQTALSAFFQGTQTTIENQADNARGEIRLALAQAEGVPVSETSSWQKVATIVWIGKQAGNSALTISEQSRFTGLDEQDYSPSALNHGTVFARSPGLVRGRVLLQGRSEHGNTQVSSLLAATHVNRSYTGLDGSFTLTATHGEGFYTLSASAVGYLTAEGSRPIKLTVGSEVTLAPVTLLGGDINRDNQIDIRDLSYVAYHLGGPDAQSDVNGDGQVDILDLTLIAGNFGKKGPTLWPISD
jgi:hypothetical protein